MKSEEKGQGLAFVTTCTTYNEKSNKTLLSSHSRSQGRGSCRGVALFTFVTGLTGQNLFSSKAKRSCTFGSTCFWWPLELQTSLPHTGCHIPAVGSVSLPRSDCAQSTPSSRLLVAHASNVQLISSRYVGRQASYLSSHVCNTENLQY